MNFVSHTDLSSRPAMGSESDRSLTWNYARAHFGKSLFWHSGELTFAWYLTEVAGLSGWAMATVMGIAMTVNALIDIMVGRHLAGIDTALARAGRTQRTGAIASALALLALFAISFMPPAFRPGFALATMLAFRIAYAVYDVPQNSMMSLGTADVAGRRRVSALRLVFGGAASVTVAGAMAAMLALMRTEDRRVAFAIAAASFALVACWTALALARTTRRFSAKLAALPKEALSGSDTVRPTLPLPVLLLAMFSIAIANSIFTKLEPYYVSAVATTEVSPGILMVAAVLGVSTGQPLWLRFFRVARKPAPHAPFLLMLLALALFGLLAPLGVVGQSVGAFLCGVAEGGTAQVMWTALANSASARAKGRETQVFGLFTGVAKLGIAAGAVAVGGTVANVGHSGGAAAGLLATMVLLPMPGIALALLLLVLARQKAG